MEKRHADLLIDCCRGRQLLKCFFHMYEMEKLRTTLLSKKINTSRFHISIDSPNLYGANFQKIFDLRRIIINENAPDDVEAYNMGTSHIKKIFDKILIYSRIWSSDVLVREIRRDRQIIRLIKKSFLPYSLLGRFQRISNNGVEVDRPILIVPGVNKDQENIILKWEYSMQEALFKKKNEYLNKASYLE